MQEAFLGFNKDNERGQAMSTIRDMLKQVDEKYDELALLHRINPNGEGLAEAHFAFPPQLIEFVDDYDTILNLDDESRRRVMELILKKTHHETTDVEDDELADYIYRYEQQKPSQSH
jgi:hypothetical protein